MTRKIDTGRIYKLVRFVVVTVSLMLIALGVLLMVTSESRLNSAYEQYINCNGSNYQHCASKWKNYYYSKDNASYYAFLTGLILPIVFFGSVAIFNYIAPSVETIKKKKK